MASPPPQHQQLPHQAEHRQTLAKAFSVSSLLSPPESRRMEAFNSSPSNSKYGPALTPLSSFNADFTTSLSATAAPHLRTPQSIAAKSTRGPGDSSLPPSPPVSPSEQKENFVGGDSTDSVRDPQLFEAHDTALGEDVPLFEDVIEKHVSNAASSPTAVAAPPRPTRDEYLLAVSCVVKAYNRDPKAWLSKELELLRLYGPRNHSNTQSNSHRVTKRPLATAGSNAGAYPLRRLAPAPYTGARKQKPIALPRLPARAPRAPRATPKSHASDSFDLYSPSSSPPKPTVKAPTSRDDVDYASLPDYCPPTTTLPTGNTKSLSVDWRVGTIDLSQDPDRHLLHDAEIYCASRLRLSCATYLCSKRRIFAARLAALRVGKEFRKTDAQQACKIDVNKASKLWTAFERVGWFEPEWMRQYL